MSGSAPQTEPQISDEAVEAAARAWLGIKPGAPFSMEQFRVTYPHACIERALAAAVPLLRKEWEAELRAQIGEDIEAERSDSDEWEYAMGLLKAAAIARGGGYDPALDGPRGAQPGGQP